MFYLFEYVSQFNRIAFFDIADNYQFAKLLIQFFCLFPYLLYPIGLFRDIFFEFLSCIEKQRLFLFYHLDPGQSLVFALGKGAPE